uniref:Uncharacterized protein n=1 Tax=Anguilla anguilla TaxID=7936 RepID=A0A0E9RZM7_ANGAN
MNSSSCTCGNPVQNNGTEFCICIIFNFNVIHFLDFQRGLVLFI